MALDNKSTEVIDTGSCSNGLLYEIFYTNGEIVVRKLKNFSKLPKFHII